MTTNKKHMRREKPALIQNRIDEEAYRELLRRAATIQDIDTSLVFSAPITADEIYAKLIGRSKVKRTNPCRLMYILNVDYPSNKITVRQCEIKTFPSGNTWAILPDKKRKLLGVSAFFTEASAKRAQLGAVTKMASDTYVKYRMPWKYDELTKFLKDAK